MRAGLPSRAPSHAPPARDREAHATLGDHRALVDRLARALAADLPLLTRDGGFIAAGYSRRARRAARAARRQPPADRRAAGELCRRDRRRDAQNPAQQRARLLHRGAAARSADKLDLQRDGRFIHRQTMANAMRFTTVELADLETQIRERRRQGAGPRARALRRSRGAKCIARADGSPLPRAAMAALDVAAALAELAVDRAYVRPVVDAATAFAIAGGRHPVVEAALRRRGRPVSSPMTASWRPSDAAVADHRPQHGRQIDLSAPERADRHPGADRQLRAGDQRADRRGRPAVQPGRRGRRSCPRPVDLHGRDGRDRGHPEPGDRRARWSSWMRSAAARRPSTACRSPGRPSSICMTPIAAGPVRHPLSRADRARGEAAGALLPHHARQGMAGRRRVPA